MHHFNRDMIIMTSQSVYIIKQTLHETEKGKCACLRYYKQIFHSQHQVISGELWTKLHIPINKRGFANTLFFILTSPLHQNCYKHDWCSAFSEVYPSTVQPDWYDIWYCTDIFIVDDIYNECFFNWK